jgi:ketosteroid isomerase-like protein
MKGAKTQEQRGAVAYAAAGNVGYTIGTFADRPSAPDRGKFTLTLRRDPSGRWLIMSDMDNGNTHR